MCSGWTTTLIFTCTRKITKYFGITLKTPLEAREPSPLEVWYLTYKRLYQADSLLFLNENPRYFLPVIVTPPNKTTV